MHLVVLTLVLIVLVYSLSLNMRGGKCSKNSMKLNKYKYCPYCYKYHNSAVNCGCDLVEYNSPFPLKQKPMRIGVNDLEQTTRNRGLVPNSNQPDHVANLWKCDHSHAKTIEDCGFTDTNFAVDYPTPIRGTVDNSILGDNSQTHLVSRFGSERS